MYLRFFLSFRRTTTLKQDGMAQQPGPYYHQQMQQQQQQLPQFQSGVNKVNGQQQPWSGNAPSQPPPPSNMQPLQQQPLPPMNGPMKPSVSYPVMTNGNNSNFSSRTSSPAVNDPRSPHPHQLQPPQIGQLQAAGSVLTPPKMAFGVASPLNASTPNQSPVAPVSNVTAGMQQMNIRGQQPPMMGSSLVNGPSNVPPQFPKVVGLPTAAPGMMPPAMNNNFPGQMPPVQQQGPPGMQQQQQQYVNGNITPVGNRMGGPQVNGNQMPGMPPLMNQVPNPVVSQQQQRPPMMPPQQPFQSQAPPNAAPNGPTPMNKRPMYPQQPPPQQQPQYNPAMTPMPQQQQQQQQPQQTNFNGYQNQQPADRLQYQNQQPNVVQGGFNRIWGQDTIDLLQNRRILPMEKVAPPPIKLNHQFHEAVNCSPDIFRCTLNKVPESNSLLQKSRLPMGILIHPFRDLNVSMKVTSFSSLC